MARKYFLKSARAGFGVWTQDDVPLAMALWGDPHVTRLIVASGMLSQEQVRDRLAREIATQAAHGVQYWPVFLIDNDEFVGCCGLRPYREEPRVREFGVHLCAAFWGRGLATELGRAVIAHAFETLKLEALFAGHHPQNERSGAMLRKLGFRYTHDEYYAPTGLMHPSYRHTK